MWAVGRGQWSVGFTPMGRRCARSAAIALRTLELQPQSRTINFARHVRPYAGHPRVCLDEGRRKDWLNHVGQINR